LGRPIPTFILLGDAGPQQKSGLSAALYTHPINLS
jgi:hypothetical protein